MTANHHTRLIALFTKASIAFFETVGRTTGVQQIAIKPTVFIGEKHPLPPIATLRNVVENSGNDYKCTPIRIGSQ